MIGTVNRVSLSYSGPPLILPLKKILDRRFPNLLRKAGGMQEDQSEVLMRNRYTAVLSPRCHDAQSSAWLRCDTGKTK
jgi:hypothetical protein